MLKTLILLAVSFIATFGWSADTSVLLLDKQDVEFVRKAAQGGLFEVRSSEIAITRGLSGQDREFAEQMITDHKSVNSELLTLAKRGGIKLSEELDEKLQSKIDALNEVSDKDFAERYLELQISAHNDAIDLFQNQVDDGNDADVKAFAIATLPTLHTHLEHAKKLEDNH